MKRSKAFVDSSKVAVCENKWEVVVVGGVRLKRAGRSLRVDVDPSRLAPSHNLMIADTSAQ